MTDIHPGFIRTPMTAHHDFKMPFLMEVDRAVSLILDAIIQKRPVYNFPWQMALLLRLVRLLPPAVFDRFARK